MFAKACAIVFAASIAGLLAQENPLDASFRFADTAEDLLYQPLALDFSCIGREYGYYADVANACQIFHICLPIEDDAGAIIDTAHWSFICGNQTVFDQSTLTCNHEVDAFPCDQSESLYNTVEFGKIPE